MGIGRGGKGERSRLETGGKKNGWWWWRWINCWTRQDKRRADTERGGIEREVSRVTGRWTAKGGVEHSSTLEGKAINAPQLKTNTCLLTSPLSWLVKSQWNNVCIGTLPLPRSIAPSKPEALTGSDAIRVEGWMEAKLEEKGHRCWQRRAAAMSTEGRRSWTGAISLGISEGVSAFDVMILSQSSERRRQRWEGGRVGRGSDPLTGETNRNNWAAVVKPIARGTVGVVHISRCLCGHRTGCF